MAGTDREAAIAAARPHMSRRATLGIPDALAARIIDTLLYGLVGRLPTRR